MFPVKRFLFDLLLSDRMSWPQNKPKNDHFKIEFRSETGISRSREMTNNSLSYDDQTDGRNDSKSTFITAGVNGRPPESTLLFMRKHRKAVL